jgi:STE24 endopeptidase
VSLGPTYAAQLSSALIKLENQNLSAPWHDWLYSAWTRSHPTIEERLRAMEALTRGGSGADKEQESKKEL